MIHIEHLRVHLPAHLGKEAKNFAAILGDALSGIPLERELRTESISIPKIKVSRSADARVVASRVADQICRAIQGGDL
ncbi:MAG: hypothetical protein JXA30_19510 [Deltaproteobacteria bacterium]|nr:hypothetical protein [Deltaproteobacteria bacterium]